MCREDLVMVMIDGSVMSVGQIPVTEGMLGHAFEQIRRETGRLDGEAVCEFHRRRDGEALSAHQRAGGHLPQWIAEQARLDAEQRGDASPVSAFPRDLEFMRARELEMPRRALNALRLFPIDRSVPLGAKEHGWRRRVGRGEAVFTRGDTQNYGHAQSGRLEEKFPVRYIVCSVRQTYFEMLSNDFAGVQQYQADLREAYRLVDERVNDTLWKGNETVGLYGVLTHPHLLRRTLSITIGGGSTSTPEAITAALFDLADTPADVSGDTMSPNVLAVSPRVYRYLTQTMITSAGTGITILRFFLESQGEDGIQRVVKAQELAGIGPNGEDGVFAFRDDADSISNIEVLPTMTMPVHQSTAMSWLTVVVAATGGLLMPDVGNNILGFVTFGG
jgi:hypothetical protein